LLIGIICVWICCCCIIIIIIIIIIQICIHFLTN
jgi:hypothetical protein